MSQHKHQLRPRLLEGLKTKDLKGLVDPVLTIDRFKSKMGEDKNIVVVGFKVSDKYPAIDLMEFIERGYQYILDADMSTGEERDGKYQVFVEFERTEKLPYQLKHMLEGVGHLCDCYDWKFRYHKHAKDLPVNEDNIQKNVPLTPIQYEQKILESQNTDVKEFFDQGAIEASLDENSTLHLTKPFSQDLELELEAMGEYERLKNELAGAIQLDESSRNQTVFLEKYLGPYEIHKIANKFLIRNGDRAVIVTKDRW